LLTDKADAEYVATIVAAWASRYLDEPFPVESRNDGRARGEVTIGEHNHKFTRTVQTDHHRWFADEPVSSGGHDLGPDPYEHLLAALGTCTSMTIRMYANHKNLPLKDVRVVLRHRRDYVADCDDCEDENRKLDVLERDISFKGDLDDKQTKKLLEIADKCPVHKTLTGEIQVTTKIA